MPQRDRGQAKWHPLRTVALKESDAAKKIEGPAYPDPPFSRCYFSECAMELRTNKGYLRVLRIS